MMCTYTIWPTVHRHISALRGLGKAPSFQIRKCHDVMGGVTVKNGWCMRDITRRFLKSPTEAQNMRLSWQSDDARQSMLGSLMMLFHFLANLKINKDADLRQAE